MIFHEVKAVYEKQTGEDNPANGQSIVTINKNNMAKGNYKTGHVWFDAEDMRQARRVAATPTTGCWDDYV